MRTEDSSDLHVTIICIRRKKKKIEAISYDGGWVTCLKHYQKTHFSQTKENIFAIYYEQISYSYTLDLKKKTFSRAK